MALGERIKACRQNAGMSQEKVAELVCVSRQAVTKWETNQTAPNTDNLFRLAEIFGTTVDLLLSADESHQRLPVEQIYDLYKQEEEKRTASRRARIKSYLTVALSICAAYLLVFLIGRCIWCDISDSSFIGWLMFARPSGDGSYLYGWLLSSNFFWIGMAVSVLPSLWGQCRFSITTFAGFAVGLLLGILFGPNPEGAVIGQSDYGWAIWGITFLISIAAGIIWEVLKKKTKTAITCKSFTSNNVLP